MHTEASFLDLSDQVIPKRYSNQRWLYLFLGPYLDALLDTPIADIILPLNLDHEIQHALIYRDSYLGEMLRLTNVIERFYGNEVEIISAALKVPLASIISCNDQTCTDSRVVTTYIKGLRAFMLLRPFISVLPFILLSYRYFAPDTTTGAISSRQFQLSKQR
ncbi:hypothetical protein A1QI_01400 [Vibrio genomosp. F10 str. 9ZB36]|nr:hypothetical protein A1QI_01400 [Vibrio genomosp. F10 str. 9ZB36]